jgi:diguanylate cyclase (GGDEF)-like protein/PAS domain S-box-containing protein
MLGILFVAALVGTIFPLTIFPDGAVVLGSCAVLLVVRHYGTGWGTLAALLAGSCAFAIWQHPFLLFVMTGEAIIVGMLMRRGMQNLLLADGIFWLLFGLPFLWIFVGTVLGADGALLLQVLLKYGLNGLGNALLATIVYHLLLASLLERRSSPLLFDSHFNLIVSAFLLPVVLYIFLNMIGMHDGFTPAQPALLTARSAGAYLELEDAASGIHDSLNEVSRLITPRKLRPTEDFRQQVDSLRRKNPLLQQIFVTDSAGKMIHSTGTSVRSAGERNLAGKDLTELQSQRLPLITEARSGGNADSHINWYIPLAEDGQFVGVVGGVINVAPLGRLLEAHTRPGEYTLTLIDRQGKIVASSNGERHPQANFYQNQGDAKQFFNFITYIWRPLENRLRIIPFWAHFLPPRQPNGNNLPWNLAVDIPREKFIAHQQRVIGSTLAIMLAPALLAIGILPLMCRKLTTPLKQLATVSSNLPEKIIGGENISWPQGTAEVNALTDNYMNLVNALESSYREVETLRENSEEAFDRVMTQQRWEAFSASRKLEQEIGKRRRIEELLEHIEAAETKYRFLVEKTLVGVYIVQGDYFSYVNPRFAEIFGYSSEEIVREGNVLTLIDQEDRAFVAGNLRRQLSGEISSLQYEFRGRRKDGKMVHVEVLNGLGTFNGRNAILGTLIDISERKQAEAKVMHMAYHDPLTGLPNRLLFNDRTEQAMAMARRENAVLALLFLDLDRFKAINDTLGHDAGDRLLCEVADRLRECVRESDTVSRFGGDEFNLLLTQVHNESDTELVAHKILRALRRPIRIEGHELHGTVSIGVALFPRDGNNVQTLIKNADTALYRAKDLGRNNYQIFSPAMNAQALERMELENSLHKVLDRRELRVYYQAQACLRTGRIIGMEALLRWQHASGEMISPATFIPLAEEIGLIFPIGEWMMRTSCRQARDWQKNGYEPMRLGINVSVQQFQDREFMDVLSRILDESGFEPKWLNVEITESVVIQDVRETIQKLKQLHAFGITVAIDDFGVGYSSLSYLKDFPIDQLKMDRSFVQNLPHSSNDAKIARHIVEMAHSLGLSVIAEGVETAEQLQFLKEIDCDEVQGYLLSRPVPAEDFERLLNQAIPFPFVVEAIHEEAAASTDGENTDKGILSAFEFSDWPVRRMRHEQPTADFPAE